MKAEKIKEVNDFKQKAFDFISLFEGFKPKAYYDSKGIPHIGYSYEYIALLSLAYINTKSLIDPKLCSALKNNNRFQAWFEIRYNSNLEKDIGTAKRRFAESNVFGL